MKKLLYGALALVMVLPSFAFATDGHIYFNGLGNTSIQLVDDGEFASGYTARVYNPDESYNNTLAWDSTLNFFKFDVVAYGDYHVLMLPTADVNGDCTATSTYSQCLNSPDLNPVDNTYEFYGGNGVVFFNNLQNGTVEIIQSGNFESGYDAVIYNPDGSYNTGFGWNETGVYTFNVSNPGVYHVLMLGSHDDYGDCQQGTTYSQCISSPGLTIVDNVFTYSN